MQVLPIQNDSRLQVCLLAATTNSKKFRAALKRDQIVRITIPRTCVEILKVLDVKQQMLANSSCPTRRILIVTAAQLCYGLTCVYREQVQILYNDSRYLYNLNTQYIQFEQKTTTTTTAVSNNVVRAIPKKSAKNNLLEFDTHELLSEVENTQCMFTSTTEIIQTTNTFSIAINSLEENIRNGRPNYNNKNLLFNDINWNQDTECTEDDDDFGELSTPDAVKFVDLLNGKKTIFDLYDDDDEEDKKSNSTIIYDDEKLRDESIRYLAGLQKFKKKSAPKFKILDDSINVLRSDDIYSQFSEEIIFLKPKIETCDVKDEQSLCTVSVKENFIEHCLPDSKTSLKMEYFEKLKKIKIEENGKFSNIVQLIEEKFPPAIQNVESSAAEPIAEESIAAEPIAGCSNYISKTGNITRKNRKLIKDRNTKLTDFQLRVRVNPTSSLRFTNSHEDALSNIKLLRQTRGILFSNPCRKLINQKLHDQFTKILKVERSAPPNDVQMLLDIEGDYMREYLPQNVVPNLDIEGDYMGEYLPQNAVQNLQNSTAINDEEVPVNEIKIDYHEQILPQPKQSNPIRNSSKKRINVKKSLEYILADINKNLQEENTRNGNMDDSTNLDIELTFKQATAIIMRKLLRNWQENIDQISLRTLLENCKRRESVFIFRSILDLSVHGYIKIIKDDVTNNIIHIKISSKTIKMLIRI